MSKRSGLSRLEDLKRGFIDIGRYRYILHKIDMEVWRNQPCPQCKKDFTEEPTCYFDGMGIHWDCSDDFIQQYYDEEMKV